MNIVSRVFLNVNPAHVLRAPYLFAPTLRCPHWGYFHFRNSSMKRPHPYGGECDGTDKTPSIVVVNPEIMPYLGKVRLKNPNIGNRWQNLPEFMVSRHGALKCGYQQQELDGWGNHFCLQAAIMAMQHL
jgi:hypothetical protein